MDAQAPISLDVLKGVSPKAAVLTILGVSLAALALLVGIIYGHGSAEHAPEWVSFLPMLNAFLNATSALFLLRGFAVRHTDSRGHAKSMLLAFLSSSLFLVSYIVYHSIHGDSKFGGQGLVRPLYFFVLISHIVLSAVVLPLIFTSFFFALGGRIVQHKKISRYTFPVWLYVSVTGVLVFALLKAYG